MDDVTDGKVTAPSLKTCKYDGIAWNALGWTSSDTELKSTVNAGDELNG